MAIKKITIIPGYNKEGKKEASKEINIFKIYREPVLRARRHGIWLVPDNDVAQYPTPIYHFNSKTLRDKTERFFQYIFLLDIRTIISICSAGQSIFACFST